MPLPDPSILRAVLKPFAFGASDKHEMLQSYLRFYQLDFPNVVHTIGKVHVAPFDIAVQTWLPKKPRGTMFIFHGYYDHVGIFRHPIEFALKRGFAVIAYDLPGHGMSTGERAAIDDFERYQHVLEDMLALATPHMPKPWYAMAQSTGAAVLTDYFLSNRINQTKSPFEKVFYFAPLVRPVHWGLNSVVHSVVSPFADFMHRKFAFNSNDPHFLNFLREADPLQPRRLSVEWVGALKNWIPRIERKAPVDISPVIIQGQKDETVDWRHNISLLQEKFDRPPVLFLPEGRHQLVNEKEALRKRMFDFIDQYLPKQSKRPLKRAS
ncbi:MAG TPA: alpha/beta hydrolase [Pseudomonadales bacterium]|nr:alpha/beta hydrolase [Pseudomonadales bacterium]